MKDLKDVCVCVFMCMYVQVSVNSFVWEHVWMPEVNLSCHSSGSIFFIL